MRARGAGLGGRWWLGLALAGLVWMLVAGVGSAWASEPWLRLTSGGRPSVLVPGSEGEVVVTAENLGNASTLSENEKGEPTPVKVVDTLPEGFEAVGIAGTEPEYGGGLSETVPLTCSLEHLSCESLVSVAPFDLIEVRIKVKVAADAASGEANTVAVSGGGAPSEQITRPLAVGDGGTPFGVEEYEIVPEEEGGAMDTQAGSHPYQVTGTIALNQGPDTAPLTGAPQVQPAVLGRDIIARLPPGLIADPGTVQRCLRWEFLVSDGTGQSPECPESSVVGIASVTVNEPGTEGTRSIAVPIFNIEPEAGEPARFGFFVPRANVPVFLNTGVRSNEDWGVDLSTPELPQNVGLSSVRVTFWGAPVRSSHDNSRGWSCLDTTRGRAENGYEQCETFAEGLHPPALVTVPTSCSGPLQSSVEADSWNSPGVFRAFPSSEQLLGMTGCDKLEFTPSIVTEPTTHEAASASGLAFDLDFNTEGLTHAEGLSQSDLEKTVVTLPEGVTIDPSAGVGLGACSEAQFDEAILRSAPGVGCPEDSKLGTVEIETPLLFTTVYGTLYLATPYANPFPEAGHRGGSLIAIYVIARSRAERGILVKLAGRVTPNPQTGQLTVTFEGDPQLPFAKFNFHFKEGQQAPLITPPTCGTFTTNAELSPFSEPGAILKDTASFDISAGSEGAACPVGPLPPFAPGIQSFTLNNNAGVFSPLAVELSRTDAMQEIADYTTDLPVGLTANLTGIPFCPEQDIEAARQRTGVQEEQEPSCPQGSLIGHTLVGTGVGSVLDYVPGSLYLAGPFHGDPFSVVSVTSAVVGPFDLGTIVIRFALAIDPFTAQVRIDPTGSEPIPTIIDGIVTHVRDIRVSIDRTGFVLNPTSCAPRPLSSTMTSNYGQTTTVSTPFQAQRCQELSFKPHFTASTSAHTSRINGASLSVKLTMPIKLGEQANIGQVKVELPPQLPARLPTLQQACTQAQFNADPAGCPPAAMIGQAKASTPIISESLVGPAIFVSHGGAEFPSLVLLLQGYGVKIELVGATHISPQGILSTTFKTIPDEPVGSFELTLPERQYSALSALGDLCKDHKAVTVKRKVTVKVHGRRKSVVREVKATRSTLIMPTEFTAQNDIAVDQSTPISVTGCPKTTHKPKHRTRRRSAARRRRR